MALARLEGEGLLDALSGGGFVVRSFDVRDIEAAIDVRGTLEGLAARLAAERYLSESQLADARQALDDLDALVFEDGVTPDSFSRYAALNERFHTSIIALADSPIVERQLAHASGLPFASANAFVLVQAALPEARIMFTVAQDQHRCVFRAIQAHEGARAEALMREHARVARRNLELVLADQASRRLLPGAQLIQLHTGRRHAASGYQG